MKKNEISVPRTARYYSYNLELESETLVYLIHGYAQLASDFLDEFKALENKNIHLVAPEGLSYFYGRERTPVSSWMTSHEREAEIEDQFHFLEEIHRQLNVKNAYKRIVVLAFSQGVSTAMRWIDKSTQIENIDLLLCSGSIPPDLKNSMGINKKIDKCKYFYGNQDRLMKENHAEIALEKLKELQIDFDYIPFIGRHEIAQETHDFLSRLI